jgi:hypothetical protein
LANFAGGRGDPLHPFFVSVAAKGFEFFVSVLESTFADGFASVDCKWFRGWWLV